MTVRITNDQFQLTAREWAPEWHGADFLRDVYPPVIKRRQTRPLADPVISSHFKDKNGDAIEFFASESQAGAMRAAHLLAPGHTLVVNLPTGFGKSLLFQTVTIGAWVAHQSVSVIVVPTTALAKEQEERLQIMLADADSSHSGTPIAYHAELAQDDKDAFRTRIRRGEQPVVIASPESVVGALRLSLTSRAERGELAWVVIDEVHMLSQWGEDFRSDFQLLAALIRQWQTAPRRNDPGNALRTLTLTATLSEETLFTLRTLLAPPRVGTQERFHLFVAAQLRQEPAYYMLECPDEPTKQSRVIEAVRHLPKPLIVYTVKPADALTLYDEIQDRTAISRMALFRGGDAGNKKGTENLRKWNRAEIDIIVATSAFGLGMDNQHVRTVIHACIPETVDRYYQEVGRGGRDGNRSLAVCLWSKYDRGVADKLAKKTRIGLEKGWERWRGMKSQRGDGPTTDTFTVNVTHRPIEITSDSDLNETWNQRTLLLMAAAQLITVSCPERKEEKDDDIDNLFQTYNIKEHRALTHETWLEHVDKERQRAAQRDERAIRTRDELFDCTLNFNKLFASTYTVNLSDRTKLVPDHGGTQCPVSRTAPPHAVLSQTAQVGWTSALFDHLSNNHSLQQIIGDVNGQFIWVHYDPDQKGRNWRGQITALLKQLVDRNFIEFALPEELFKKVQGEAMFTEFERYLVLKRLDNSPPSVADPHTPPLPLPRVSVMGRGQTPQDYRTQLRSIRATTRPKHVVVFPSDLADPDQPERRFQDAHNTQSLAGLLTLWSN